MLLIGCQTTHYRAASLPHQLRVPLARRTNDINLASMASQGASSSQLGQATWSKSRSPAETKKRLPSRSRRAFLKLETLPCP